MMSEFEDEETYSTYEVNRQGDDVWMIFSSEDGVSHVTVFSAADAITVGLALIEAGDIS